MKRNMSVFVCALALCVTGISACGWFDDPSPDEARVRLEGNAGDTVQLLVSKQFVAGTTESGVTQVELLDSETLTRTLPFDTTITITTERRFFIRVNDADSVNTEVRMEVLIDNESRYDQQGLVNVQQLLFVFLFNQPIGSVIELLL